MTHLSDYSFLRKYHIDDNPHLHTYTQVAHHSSATYRARCVAIVPLFLVHIPHLYDGPFPVHAS